MTHQSSGYFGVIIYVVNIIVCIINFPQWILWFQVGSVTWRLVSEIMEIKKKFSKLSIEYYLHKSCGFELFQPDLLDARYASTIYPVYCSVSVIIRLVIKSYTVYSTPHKQTILFLRKYKFSFLMIIANICWKSSSSLQKWHSYYAFFVLSYIPEIWMVSFRMRHFHGFI